MPQCVDQWLQLYAAATDPLRQGRARDGETGPAEDLFLPVQRQMVGELGHHDPVQQPYGRDALVDHLDRNRRLGQGFASLADLLAVDMPLHREDARGVELFADILADALELAATGALRVVRLAMDQRAGELRRRAAFSGPALTGVKPASSINCRTI